MKTFILNKFGKQSNLKGTIYIIKKLLKTKAAVTSKAKQSKIAQVLTCFIHSSIILTSRSFLLRGIQKFFYMHKTRGNVSARFDEIGPSMYGEYTGNKSTS